MSLLYHLGLWKSFIQTCGRQSLGQNDKASVFVNTIEQTLFEVRFDDDRKIQIVLNVGLEAINYKRWFCKYFQ